MKKYIEVIGREHKKIYNEGIDTFLDDHHFKRFLVEVNKTALKHFIRLSKRISYEELPDGALLMLGYVKGIEKEYRYFSKGVNPDIAEKRLKITRDYKPALEKIIKRAKTGDKHDGAFLITPDGKLQHSGYGLEPHTPTILEAYGYKDYPHKKKELGIIEGGFRLKDAISQSMLFINAVFASISKDSDQRKYFVINGRIFPILQNSIIGHYDNLQEQFYQPPQRL